MKATITWKLSCLLETCELMRIKILMVFFYNYDVFTRSDDEGNCTFVYKSIKFELRVKLSVYNSLDIIFDCELMENVVLFD